MSVFPKEQCIIQSWLFQNWVRWQWVFLRKRDSACPKEFAIHILSDSDHSTKVAPTTLNSHKSLLDVCTCKCRTPGTSCTCNVESKVPPEEVEFLLDQSGPRKMYIGSKVVSTTRRLQQQIVQKQLRSAELCAQGAGKSSGTAKNSSKDWSSEKVEAEDSTTGSEFDPGPRARFRKHKHV